jgi:hypothetical protein
LCSASSSNSRMKLFIAAILVALAAAKLSSNELRDGLTDPAELPPFKAGQEYRYRFDSQIATGIAEISHQKALTRVQAEASLYFNSDRLATLRLDNIRVGAANARMVQHADRIHPFELVERKEIESEQLNKLKLPLQFNYVDGLIEQISFDVDDDVWSKNIKRSVLNLLQVNLKARNLREEQKNEVKSQDPSWKSLTPRMFTAPETTIEGECDTTYIVNKLENVRRNDVDFFNVTKTVDFKQCKKLADVHYGPQAQQRLTNKWQEQEPRLTEEEQKLQRSTILRHFVVGTPEKFSIKKVESVSQYTFKSLNAEQETPMTSVVVNELTCIGVSKNPSERPSSPSETRVESLLYSNEFDRDVKRFYMYGDEEYPQETPFSKIQNKQKLIFDVLRQIQKATEDKKIGVEAEATVLLPRLVELLRTCSVKELEEITSRADRKAEEILLDALSLAATRNTIHVLADKILKQKIPVSKAIQSLKALSGAPAPSDKQVQILTRLCKSESVKQSESLRQSCWLTAGALMGEFCETSQQNSYVINKKANDEVCPRHVTDKFIEDLSEEYQTVSTRYEKILILKALGNAGLQETLPKLKKIIHDQKEDPLVRAQAIDSLRRLRKEIPTEIQKVLMPVFKNQQELTEVRLHALSLVMQTNPDNGVLDQVAFVLLRERSKNVKSFVYDITRAYAESPIAEEQRLAQHLKAIVKLAGVDEKEEEKMRSSRAYHTPIYSNQQNEGVFLNWESIFSSDNAFPKKVSAGLDSFLNGIFEKNTVDVSFQQEDLERWYKKLVNTWLSTRSRSSSTSGRRSEDELSSIFSNLDIKARRESENHGRKYTTPFGFISIRVRDIDYAVLPLEDEFLPESLRKVIIDGEKPNLRNIDGILSLLNGQNYQMNTAWNFYERMTKVPTTAGIPLKLTLSVPALVSLEGSGRLRSGGVALKVQPSIAISHVKKIEAWCPLVNSGAENVVSFEFNVPLEGEVLVEGSEKKSIKLSAQVPEFEHRLLGFHSLPVTYTRDYDRETRVHKEPQVKTIRNERLEQRDRQLNHFIGQKTLGLPFHINGHIHSPAKISYISIFDALMTSENHVHVEFKPTDETPRQVQLKLEGEAFRKFESRLRPQFNSFYDKFDEEMEKRYNFQEQEKDNQDEQNLGKVVERYESRKLYKHALEAELKTVGGRTERSAKLEVETICDDRFGYCKAQVNIRRDAMLEGEEREWKLTSTIQTLLPEPSADYEQQQEKKDEKNQKFICSIDSQWGTNGQQFINLRVNGEQAKTQEWIDVEQAEVERKKDSNIREKTAFLNKYDISAEYKLESQVKNVFSRGLDYFKLLNFWNTKTETVTGRKENGLVTALVVIDPISREHLNISINTPTEKIRVNTISTPVKVAPFPLIRRQSQSINSAHQLLTSVISKKDSAQECSVDGTQVRTFDEVTFKAPITKCYTVLAKDCNRDSRFAVLMKKTNGENKKLKVINKNGNVVEVERDSENQNQFRINVNGDAVEEQEWESYGISKLDNTITVESGDVTVRFNGRQAWIKISQLYKNNQCGVCGHYDDDQENEFVQGNNEKTSDLRQYYGSFTLKDGECDSDFEENTRKHKFETVDSDEFDQGSNSEEGDGEEPIEKTQVMEYNHKICFSMKPVRECPRNRYPTANKKDAKVQFGCLSRDSVQARRLLRQLKNENVLDEVRDLAPSFVETIKTPTKCVEL